VFIFASSNNHKVAFHVVVAERVYSRENLIKRVNGNLSHKTPRSQTGSLRVEGSEGRGTYNYTYT